MKRSSKRARISGTSTQGLNITQNLHSNQGMDAFRLQNKTALNVRLKTPATQLTKLRWSLTTDIIGTKNS
jgi:hypothetical protein